MLLWASDTVATNALYLPGHALGPSYDAQGVQTAGCLGTCSSKDRNQIPPHDLMIGDAPGQLLGEHSTTCSRRCDCRHLPAHSEGQRGVVEKSERLPNLTGSVKRVMSYLV